MPELIVKPVETGREKRQFLHFPWTLYRGDPNWIPPLRMDQKELVGYSHHPFYERNQVQTFLAYRGREVCGRIAAILNRDHNERHQERRGFFGFFECIDDQQVANGLLDATREWFAKQGIHLLRGPANPSVNYEMGLLIDGFDSPPTFMMSYNPDYYGRLLENYGLRKSQDMYAFWGHVDMLPAIQEKLGPLAEQVIERFDVKLRPMDPSRFLEEVRMFLDIYNRAMANTWGFVPMSPGEIEHVAKGLRYLIVPEMALMAEVDGRVVGASFGLPDYNPRIREIDGRLFPFGLIRLLRNKRAIKKIRMISTNVIPEFQLMGVGLALMHGLVPLVLDWGLEEAEFSWVMESNSLSYGSLKKGGAKITKTYRLYDMDCTEQYDMDCTEQYAETTALTTSRPVIHSYPAVPKGPLEIREVQGRGDLNQFCRAPWRIYADDPQWIPPLLIDVKEFLNPKKHPFYQHGDATQFLATRGGTPVGRILVSDDPNYNRRWQTNVGCFGMFESMNDREIAHGLLDAAAGWLHQRGRDRIMGPIDYSTNYPCGLLIDGFDTPPRVMMNHNRVYYADLLQSWGLNKAKDLYAWWFDGSNKMLARWERLTERVTRRSSFTIRPFRLNDFAADVEACRAIYNGSMRDHWGFVKMTEAEFHYLAKRLAQLAMPELVLLAEVDGQPVGMALTIPDVNEAIRPLDGRLTKFGLPINLARLTHRLKRVKAARVLVLDVLDKFRGRGIAELLIMKTITNGRDVADITTAELGWTLEDNDLVNRTIQRVGCRHYKTFRIYDKPLDRTPSGATDR